MRPSAQQLLQFWFGMRPYTAVQVRHHSRIWFGEPGAPELTPQTDELIRERYGELALAAEQGKLSAWESSPRRRLALILLLDQFSRNIYRGSGHAFAQDLQALSLTVSGKQLGADATLDPIERLFFYMPLMHAESLDVQEESVVAFRRLVEEAPANLRRIFDSNLRYALLHRGIIERFGRFPSRNEALGRHSTPEEIEWLASDGRAFAQ
jgi:uncharacterized protein (DUF924 family)